MTPVDATNSAPPSLIEAAWKHRLLVVAITIAFAAVGFLVALARGDVFTADAAVVIERNAGVSASEDNSASNADRQMTNQLELMRSRRVAERAGELASELGVDVTTQDIFSRAVITVVPESDVIEVSFSAESPEGAEIVTGAIIDGYRDVRREQRALDVQEVLRQLDSTQAVLQDEVKDVSTRLAEQLSDRALETRIGVILDDLSDVQQTLAAVSAPEIRASLLEQIAALDQQLRTLQLASAIELEQPGVANLVSERADIESRLAAVEQLRIQIESEAASEGTGVALLSAPAAEGAGGSLLTALAVLVGAFVGLVVAFGVAYFMVTSRRRFSDSREPEGVLAVPYLADIPVFEDVDVNGRLPVLTDPRSPAAEAFRFVAASVGFRATRAGAKIIVMASGQVGAGKSTVATNLALAAARSGKNVLLVDTDFGNQASSRLLLGDISLGKGLPELLAGTANLSDVVRQVSAGPDATIDLLSRGAAAAVAPDLFAKSTTAEAMRRLADYYDLVILDPPPLLQVAYASNVAQTADAAVVVVSHGSDVERTEDLRSRLELIEADILGYIYNRAPVRADMLETGGSMMDVLGDSGKVDDVAKRQSR